MNYLWVLPSTLTGSSRPESLQAQVTRLGELLRNSVGLDPRSREAIVARLGELQRQIEEQELVAKIEQERGDGCSAWEKPEPVGAGARCIPADAMDAWIEEQNTPRRTND